jgi:Ca2+-binding RTX toxin-like protein
MAIIRGTALPDTLLGTGNADRLVGLGGGDIMTGLVGDDQLHGGAGDDFMYGGAGYDTLFGGTGEDFFYGGSGGDTANYASSTEAVRLNLLLPGRSGGAALGDQFLSMERFALTRFNDVFIGSAEADTVFGSVGEDTLRGGAGADQLFGGADRGVLDGGDGHDVLGGGHLLYGGDGNDTLRSASAKAATLWGGAGDDTLRGSLRDDMLFGGLGRDRMLGSTGRDTVSYADAGAAVTVNMANGELSIGAAAGDRFSDIEVLVLSRYGDRLMVGGAQLTVFGGGGNDTVTGRVGRELLSGDAGRDWINAGGGNDLVFGGSGFDLLYGGAGNDTLYGGAEAVPDAFPRAFGVASGGAGADSMYGGNVRDVLSGGADADSLFGGAGADTLTGDAGRDSLVAGAGDDVLTGGSGGDILNGGAGIDTARYTTTVTYDAGSAAQHTGDAAGDVVSSVERLAFLGANSVYVGNGAAMTIFASAAGLQVRAGSGAETVFDATGTMAVSFAVATQGVTLTSDLTALIGGGAAAGDTYVGAREVTLTGFDDVVTLDAAATTASFFAGAGNDTFSLIQSPQAERLAFAGRTSTLPTLFDGGDGDDVCTISSYDVTVTLIGGAGNDTLLSDSYLSLPRMSGGAGDDVMSALTSFEGGNGRGLLISGDDGDDAITVRCRNVGVSGGAGNDTISAIYFVSGQRIDKVDGGEGDDMITITVQQLPTPDFPGTALLQVNGGAGDDTIRAAGSQGFFAASHVNFIFNADWGNDDILQFADEPGIEGGDLIVFENTAASGLDSFDDLTVTQGVGFTLVSFGTNAIRLEGITATSFTADDVLFT